MKKAFYILCLLFPLYVTAQTKDYKPLKSESLLQKAWDTDYVSVNEIADGLFSVLNKNYVRENYSGKGGYYIVSFFPDEFDRSSGVASVSFQFFKTKIGENKDLGVDGKRVFRFSKIEGNFLDLYPIWEQLRSDFALSPDNKENIVKERQSVFYGQHNDGSQFTYVFSKKGYGSTDNIWNIELMYYTK